MRNACASAFVVLAATLPQNQTQPPTVRGSAAGILMDVTVLDKDGHPVTDLKSEDFELTEDGKPQQIVSTTLMRGGVPSPCPATLARQDQGPRRRPCPRRQVQSRRTGPDQRRRL